MMTLVDTGWPLTRGIHSLKERKREMMTLVRWDDRGEEMNQEEADQDVADEVSEEVDSRGEVMRSEENDGNL